jgi:autotransporter-associated beta strand protein
MIKNPPSNYSDNRSCTSGISLAIITKNFLLIIGLSVFVQVKALPQTNNYFGISGALNGAVWSANPSGPYTSLLNSTGGAILHFANAANITGATLDVSGINVSANLNWINTGTLGTGGSVLPINVASGITFNMSQTTSGAVGTGFNKLGSGVLAMSGGSNYSGGFTLSEGTFIAGGVNAMGGNRLSLNGGIIASSLSLDLSGKYTGGIIIGGNIQWGDIASLANGTAGLKFNDSVFLGAVNRTLTIGNSGTIIFGGPISNIGAPGLSLTANANGNGIFEITHANNTFSGPINVLGGKVRFASDGSLGNAANILLLDGGKLLSKSSFSLLHAIQLGNSVGTGIVVASTDTLTITGVIADKTVSGSFAKSGAGLLILTNANTFTGNTFIDAAGGILQLNHLGGNTLPVSNNVMINGGKLMVSSNQTLNDLSLVNGNLQIDDGVSLTINGTFDYFQAASISMIGTGKIVYGPLGILKYSGTNSKIASAIEFPNTNGPYTVTCDNIAGLTLPFTRTIRGKLVLSAGKFTIGAGALLELDGASLESSAGYLSGNTINGSSSNLIVKGNTGGTVILPTNNLNIGLNNVTIGGTRTLALNGSNNLVLAGNLLVEKGAVFDNGGESQITSTGGAPSIVIDGKFINRDKDNFTGSNGAIPGIVPMLNPGCIIEYGLATGNLQVVTARNDYRNISFSGSGIKTLASGFNPAGTVYITGTAVVDAQNNSFGDAGTNLTMDGGRFKLNGANNPQPHMSGDYQLTGGVIEFACNSISGQTIRSRAYQNIEVSGLYVGNSNGNIFLNSNGTFKVISGGVFTINDNSIKALDNTSGQTVTVENNGTFLCGNSKGFNGFTATLTDNSSIHSNIPSVSLAAGMPGSNVHYTKAGDQPITNANGLVYGNLYLSGTGNKTAPNGKLTIQGNFLKNTASVFQHNNGSVIFSNASAAQMIESTVEPNFIYYDLTNNNSSEAGLQINSNISLAHELTLLSSSKLSMENADIRLLSTAINTSRVASIPSTASVIYNGTGSFVVERYFPNANPLTKRAWRMVTAPVKQTGTIFENWQLAGATYDPTAISGNAGSGTLITGPVSATNGLDYTPTNNYSLKRFINKAYTNISNTKSPLSIQVGSADDNLADNTAYFLFVRGDRNPALTNTANSNATTLSSRGRLQHGAQHISVNNDIELVGNPYASPIDFNLINKSNNVYARRFYVWDPNLNRVGGFVVMDDFSSPGNYFPKAPYGASSQRNYIQSGQAFMVERISNSPAILQFEEGSKANFDNGAIFRPIGIADQVSTLAIQLQMQIEDTSFRLADGTLLEFNNLFSDSVDKEDALKLININESFNVNRNGKALAVERRSVIRVKDTIFFQLSRTTPRNYQFSFSPINMDSSFNAFLEDEYLAKKYPVSLTVASTYPFSVNSDSLSLALNRFRIVFNRKENFLLNGGDSIVKAFRINNHILVEWTGENKVDISKYEVEKSSDGIHFTKVYTCIANWLNQVNATYSWRDIHPFTGNNFYRIRSVTAFGNFKYSSIVLVKNDESNSGISLQSNPVRDGAILLFFKNLPAGVFKVRLINSAGQTIINKHIYHALGSSLEKINSGGKMVPGIYQLEITSPDKEVTVIKVVIS